MKKIIVILILFTSTVYAQEGLLGPHGGRMKVSDVYRIETVGCDSYLEIYLFNEKLEPIFNNGVSGEIKFYAGKTNQRSALRPYGIDGFTAAIPALDYTFYEISFDLLERMVIKAKFQNECLPAHP